MVNYKSIGYIITIINRYSNIYFMEAMKDLRLHGSGQIRIVLTLSKFRQGVSQEKLAKSMLVDKGSISRMIRPLIANGIVERNINPEDKRAYIIKLTDKVQAMIPEIQDRARNWTDILAGDLSPQDIEKLIFYLEKLEANAKNHIKGYTIE